MIVFIIRLVILVFDVKSFFHNKKRMFNLFIVLVLFMVVFYSNVIWLRLDFGTPRIDGMTHYKNTLIHLGYLKTGNLQRFFFPERNDFYPNFIYQATALFFMAGGCEKSHAILFNSIFLLILALAAYFVGETLWDESTGLLSAVAALSLPIVLDYSRIYHLDVQSAALAALCCLFIIKSRHFERKSYTFLFFITLAIGLLTKWTTPFFLSGLFLISFWNLIPKEKDAFFKSFLPLLAGVMLAVGMPFIFYPLVKARDDMLFHTAVYFSGIAVLGIYIFIVQRYTRSPERLKNFFTGVTLFFIFCWHFYYFKFIDLFGLYSSVASEGVHHGTSGFFHRSEIHLLGFMDFNWLIFYVAGILFYIFGKKDSMKTYYICGIILPLFLLIYHPRRLARYVIPMVIFVAPVMVFWISRMKSRLLAYFALFVLLLQSGVSLFGRTLPPKTKLYLKSFYNRMHVRKYTTRAPVILRDGEREDIDFLVDCIHRLTRKGSNLVVFLYNEKIKNKINYNGIDVMFKYYTEKIPGMKGYHYGRRDYISTDRVRIETFLIMRGKKSLKMQELVSVESLGHGRYYAFGEQSMHLKIAGSDVRILKPLPGRGAKSSWMSPTGNIYVLFLDGTIKTFENFRWRYHSKVKPEVVRIWGLSDERIYAVGHCGIFQVYQSDKWRTIPTGHDKAVAGVWGVSADRIYLVGVEGYVGIYENGVVRRIKCDPSFHFYDIMGKSDGEIIAVGKRGLIARIRGNKVEAPSYGGSIDYFRISLLPDGGFQIVGDDGAYVHIVNGKIEKGKLEDAHLLTDAAGDGGSVVMVGDELRIFRKTDVGGFKRLFVKRSRFDRIVLIRFMGPGDKNSAKPPFKRILRRKMSYSNVFQKTESLPGTGLKVEIFELVH